MTRLPENFRVNDNLRRKIVDDLAVKYPVGRLGRLKKLDYVVSRDWSYHHEGYRNITILKADHQREDSCFGWEDELIWNLKLHDYNSVRRYLRSDKYTESCLSEHAVSRRANRIWIRIDPILRRVRNAGRPGIYRVGYGYGGHGQAYVYAEDTESAKIYTDTMLAAVLKDPKSTGYTARAELIEIGTAVLLTNYNDDTAASMTHDAKQNLAQAEERLVVAKEKLVRAEQAAMIIQSLSGMQIAASLEDN